MFACYLWLCSRWNFCNRSTLRENILQNTMCYFFLRHGVVNAHVTLTSNFQMCHRLKVDKNSSCDWPATFSHVIKLSSTSQIWKGCYFLSLHKSLARKFSLPTCHSMLATPIGVTTRMAVCSRSGAHYRNYLFFLWTWQYHYSPQIWLTWYTSTRKITFKDYGKKQNVSNKHTKDILIFTITYAKHYCIYVA